MRFLTLWLVTGRPAAPATTFDISNPLLRPPPFLPAFPQIIDQRRRHRFYQIVAVRCPRKRSEGRGLCLGADGEPNKEMAGPARKGGRSEVGESRRSLRTGQQRASRV